MAQTKEQAIIEKIYEMTEANELTWHSGPGGYLAEHDALILQLVKEDNQPFLQVDGRNVEIRESDIGYSGRLSELEMIVSNQITRVEGSSRPAYDAQRELQGVLDQLNTKA